MPESAGAGRAAVAAPAPDSGNAEAPAKAAARLRTFRRDVSGDAAIFCNGGLSAIMVILP
jgi:hypothetical protein